MSKKHKQVFAFSLEGKFLGFELEDGYKIKRLNLSTPDGEYCIKLSKEARTSVQGVLIPGNGIWVLGEKTINPETQEVKYKARLIRPVLPGQNLSAHDSTADSTAVSPTPLAAPVLSGMPMPAEGPASEKSASHCPEKRKGSILMCQKSDCMKRGGRAVLQTLQQTLGDRGLTDEVAIKMTGCMKHCKAGPNLVVMPNKTRYSQIKAKEIPALIDQHFAPPEKSERSSNLVVTG
jgi:(2Fe-2S) ferredoxin